MGSFFPSVLWLAGRCLPHALLLLCLLAACASHLPSSAASRPCRYQRSHWLTRARSPPAYTVRATAPAAPSAVAQESEVLDELDHPCIANKISAFQTASHLYVVRSARARLLGARGTQGAALSVECAAARWPSSACPPSHTCPVCAASCNLARCCAQVLEFAPGGDLYDKLQTARQFSFDDTRVYIAQVCALP